MKIVFMGTPDAAVETLRRIVDDGHRVLEVWTQPDRPSGRGRNVKAPPVKRFAEEAGIPVFQPEKIRLKDVRRRFAGLGADVAVVVAYGRILTKTYLEAFRYGCINVHFSLLPKYRGAAPVNWAIANGETKTGVTTMKMDRGLDTGDMLLSREVEIESAENAIELMVRLSLVGAELLSETLSRIDEIKPVPQNDEHASYAPMFKKSDGLVDWSMSAGEIVNRIRGFQPFPKSYSFIGGKRVTFFAAQQVNAASGASPGEILKAASGRIEVACGAGTLMEIEELQIAGGKRMDAAAFLNGKHFSEGDVFQNE